MQFSDNQEGREKDYFLSTSLIILLFGNSVYNRNQSKFNQHFY